MLIVMERVLRMKKGLPEFCTTMLISDSVLISIAWDSPALRCVHECLCAAAA
jgi:hypothetical protein